MKNIYYLYINKNTYIMTFKEYLDKLNKFAKDKPETLDFTVISAIDDEGNGYNPVFFDPTLGRFEDGEFDTELNDEDFDSICIN
jgi:hypothetical protein